MKKSISTLLIILFVSGFAMAKKVNLDKARKVATTFVEKQKHYSYTNLTLAYSYELTTQSEFVPDIIETLPLLYVFNIGSDNGVILVSGDDVAMPILGYTTSGSFDHLSLPINFKKWIDGYQMEILEAIENETAGTQKVNELWNALLEGIYENDNTRAVGPLVSSTWNQAPYYNDLCPGGSVTGCVATAMAQVMKYWNHPAQGTGSHSYNHPVYGTQTANFGSTTYEWSQMPNYISAPNNAVAVLNYHCGVSVDMNYSPQWSGAYVIEKVNPVCAESALKNYFGYSNSTHGELSSEFSSSQWMQMIYNDLDAGNPIVYCGASSDGQGGHAFVCDGYDAGEFFHFNWGWGGAHDGFFQLDAMDTPNGSFSHHQRAIFGLVPETTTSTHDLRLYDNLVVNPSNISLGDGFTVNAVIGNFGNYDFTGEFAAYIFDGNGNSVDYVDIISGSLTSNYYNTFSFSTTGISSLLPGSYTISIYYRESGGEWVYVGNGDYNNSVSLTVGNVSDIELYSPWNISCGTTITQYQSFDIYIDIANNGSTIFNGALDVSLYDLEGNFVETIGSIGNQYLNPGYYYSYTFSSYGLTIAPGTYLLALGHTPNYGNWMLSGSSFYPNPIQVIIREPAEQADIYEPNDAEYNATNLQVNFTGNNAVVNTAGSNSDNGADIDYYNLSLPSGYNYTITARVHDSYNSGNGQTYTNDVLWSYNAGLFWSSAYDDIMPGNIIVNNGGPVKFCVSPYYFGYTGTYLLDIQIVRTPLDVDDIFGMTELSIYPNPVRNMLNIQLGQVVDIGSIQILDVSGSKVKFIDKPTQTNGSYSISVDNLKSGTYFVSIFTDEKVYHKKFIKTK